MSHLDKEKFITQLDDDRALLAIINSTRLRASLCCEDPAQLTGPDDKTVERAIHRLLPYALVYKQYFQKVVTEIKPRANDWGDLECFIYVDDDVHVATNDALWIDIVDEIGLGDLVFSTK